VEGSGLRFLARHRPKGVPKGACVQCKQFNPGLNTPEAASRRGPTAPSVGLAPLDPPYGGTITQRAG